MDRDINLRPATGTDLVAVAQSSTSRGIVACPDETEWTWAIEKDGQILAVGGAKRVTEATAWCWLDLAEAAQANIKEVWRTIQHWVNNIMAETGLTRLMAAVRVDFDEAIRTVEHLGFHCESTMERFFGEQSAFLFVKLKEI